LLKLRQIPESSRRQSPTEEAAQGRYPLVQASHLRKAQPFRELTQDQRLDKARIERRVDAIAPEILARWPFPELTHQQQIERLRMENALRGDKLRGAPSCFGALA
jgi:hypothetical protein